MYQKNNSLKLLMNNLQSIRRLAKTANALTKAIALTFSFLLFFSVAGFAQCDKSLVLTCSKTEYHNAEGVVQRTVEEECVIKVSKSEVSISHSGHAKMIASVTSTVCEWKQPFKVGKTTMEATFKHENGDTRKATIIIEGKDGKITCVMKEKERADRVIKATASKFEEQK
jgi:hypothetical protein